MAISTWVYVDQDETFEEYQEIFADEPELQDAVTPADLPPSYRVTPVDPDADVVDEVAGQFNERPGVRNVVSASEAVREIQNQADKVGRVFLAGSGLLLVASTLLILTNVVSAIRNRGQEIEIMKVVGATNWFIRVPFILEGLAQALIGAGLAMGGLVLLDRFVIDEFDETNNLQLLDGFTVDTEQLYFTGLLIVGIAVLAAGIGSMVAVSRYLKA